MGKSKTNLPNLTGVWKACKVKIASIDASGNDSITCADIELYFKNQIKGLLWITQSFKSIYPEQDAVISQAVGSLFDCNNGNFVISDLTSTNTNEFVILSRTKLRVIHTQLNKDGSVSAYTATFKRIKDESCPTSERSCSY